MFFPDEEYMFPESGFDKLDAGNLGKNMKETQTWSFRWSNNSRK